MKLKKIIFKTTWCNKFKKRFEDWQAFFPFNQISLDYLDLITEENIASEIGELLIDVWGYGCKYPIPFVPNSFIRKLKLTYWLLISDCIKFKNLLSFVLTLNLAGGKIDRILMLSKYKNQPTP